jgi:arylsulfate sulfotransferase
MYATHSSARRALRIACACLSTLFICGRALAFELVPNLPSPQPLGTTITWSVTGDPPQPGDKVDFRLAVRPGVAGESTRIVYDYTKQRDFEWTPMQEMPYTVTAFVRNTTSGETTRLRAVFVALPRAMAQPVVTTTRNPLVALYSAPPCALGLTMEVAFAAAGDPRLQATDRKACDGNLTVNIFVAGMRAQTTYRLRHVLRDADGNPAGGGAPIPFTTGTPEPGLPTVRVTMPPGPSMSEEDDILLTAANSGTGTPIATDLEGNLVWYYTSPDQGQCVFLRTRPGGNLFLLSDPVVPEDRDVLREVDLASNIVRQTTSRRVTEVLRGLGQPPISLFHHEARILPNGHLLIFGSTERIFVDVQGPGPVDVLGDMVIDLDENMQPVWAAKMFDVLDVSRPAVLGEVCLDGEFACPPLWLDDQANDWTHTNSIDYSPGDGNLIVSSRHQDWIFKIDYRDGAGTGGLIWRLGREGDFTLAGAANDAWFSHQHDANYIGDDQVLLYDNGNGHADCLANPAQCVSYGKVYALNEAALTATPVLNASLGNYSFAIGAAQRLSNGNYAFTSGIYAGSGRARSHEVDPDGNMVFELEVSQRAYRSFRLRDLYTPPEY